ncbi:MAG: Panacea domain-containing protein [Candidatus Altiarchaeota archaeon]|nr:Panacea domain-containing protein [Candidatus Altiarchaeota archaeon]
MEKLIAYYTLKIKNMTSFKMVKFIYLTEMLYLLKKNRRMTDIPFFYWDHGPYSKDIEEKAEEINGKTISIKEITTAKGYEATVYDSLINEKDIELPPETKKIADEIIRDFGEMENKEIKDFVYNTIPLKNTEKREKIDLSMLYTDYIEDEKAKNAKINLLNKIKAKGVKLEELAV